MRLGVEGVTLCTCAYVRLERVIVIFSVSAPHHTGGGGVGWGCGGGALGFVDVGGLFQVRSFT